MSYAAGIIDGYKQVSDKSDELIDKEQVVIEEKKQQPVDLSSEPFESFVVTLAETLKKQKQSKRAEVVTEKPILSVVESSEEIKTEEPFQTFISKLGNALEKEKKKKTSSIVKELKSVNKIVTKDTSIEEKQIDLVEPKSSVSKYAEELAKDRKNEIKESDEEIKIKSIVSEQINRVRQLYPNAGVSVGGGGTNAVQYANGGTMNGDLNVLGRYLSGGVDLAEVFSGSVNGFSDRLISGSQILRLSSDGSLVFQTTNGEVVLSNSNNTFNVENLNTTETLLSGGVNLSELFLPKEQFIIDGGDY
jgi:hypothetical protein